MHSPGNIPAFGINLADKVLHHRHVVQAIPYASLILIAIGLQYFQMRQLNNRNPRFAQSNPQAQMMQRYMPLIFAVIYINIAAGVNIYFIISSLCRIGIQEAIFRSGTLNKAGPRGRGRAAVGEGGRGRSPAAPLMERLADMQKQALEQKEAQQRAQRLLPPGDGDQTAEEPAPPPAAKGRAVVERRPEEHRETPRQAARAAAPPGRTVRTARARPSAKNTNGAGTNGAGDKKTTHPRSKTKRERKDR